MFETLEQANEYKLEMDKKYNDLQLAHEGLQAKLEEETSTLSSQLNDYQTKIEEANTEIQRLKIKNYDYMQQIATSYKDPNNDFNNSSQNTEPSATIDDIINDFKF